MKDHEKPWWYEALFVFSKVTAWIVFPVLIALFLGKYLDKRWGTAPYAFFGLIAFSFVISVIMMVRIILAHASSLEAKDIRKKENGN